MEYSGYWTAVGVHSEVKEEARQIKLYIETTSLNNRILELVARCYWTAVGVHSEVYGEPRATQDIDMVAELKNHHIQALIANTQNAFYIEEADVIRAVLGTVPSMRYD